METNRQINMKQSSTINREQFFLFTIYDVLYYEYNKQNTLCTVPP